MSLGLSCGLRQVIQQKLLLTVQQVFGESSGDIPLYSLHRIKNMMRKKPIAVSDQIVRMLIKNLFQANQDFREERRSTWYCLTANYFIEAISNIDGQLADMIEKTDLPQNRPHFREKILEAMHVKRQEAVQTIKQWFLDNHDDLIYVMGRKIPWPIVLRLRANIKIWVTNADNPFDQPIEEMILEVGQSEGLQANDAEEVWKIMGGELPKRIVEI